MIYARRVSAVVTTLVVAFSLACAAAAAGTPHGVLTKPEYQQLSTMYRDLALSKGTVAGLKAARRVCRRVPDLSKLVRDEKADCLSGLNFYITDFQAQSAAKDCATQTNEAQAVQCELPAYTKLQQATQDAAHTDKALTDATTARGFRGVCKAVLAFTPKQLTAVQHAANALGRLLTALQTENASALKAAAAQADAALSIYLTTNSTAKLSVCPHE